MSIPRKYSFSRYLASKKSVDDRALNRFVWNTLFSALPKVQPERPLRLLEVGAGIGTMIERLINWDLLTYAEYTAVDADANNFVEARRRYSQWAVDNGFPLRWMAEQQALIQMENGQISLTYNTMDIYDFFSKTNTKWEILIAHAFMDLVDIADVLSRFCSLLEPGGLLYLTLNYDGETILLPSVNTELDEQIMYLYNKSMDDRTIHGKQAGDSKTGRHLLHYLQSNRLKILAAGSSDWIVYPDEQNYPEDEAYFLHFIVHTIHSELNGHPTLHSQEFDEWVKKRHAQIERGELIYIAKQLDFLAQVPYHER